MSFTSRFATALLLVLVATPVFAQTPQTVRIVGKVVDSYQALGIPGAVLEVVGQSITATTDLEGRYAVNVPPGRYELRFAIDGFTERLVSVDATAPGTRTADVVLELEGLEETVTVVAEAEDLATAAVQLLERRRAPVITDNIGGVEMKANADSSAAGALQRVTGLSVVDNEFVFVRGLGERYSNTTLNGATLPSTQPERKVVSLDMFPAGLLQSVSVVKTYTADRPAEFAGGLVEIVPNQLPNARQASFSYSFGGNGQSWGEDILDHTSASGDFWGLPNDERALPAGFPERRLIRGGIYTPELGFTQDQLKGFSTNFVNAWSPSIESGSPSQGFSASFGDRFGKLGIAASLNHSYEQDYQEEEQVYYSSDEAGNLLPFSTYEYKVGAAKGTLAGLGNIAYAFTPSQEIAFQVFSTNKGLRETRTFEGYNDDAARNLRNARLLWQEESLQSYQLSGAHFFAAASNSRLEWRGSYAKSSRDEPDIRETLYEEIGDEYYLADESQSGLRMFNDLDETTKDFTANWTTTLTQGPAGLPATIKFGTAVSQRDRDFSSRRFRFVPIDVVGFDLSPAPEELFTQANIGFGSHFELREETRTTDTYMAEQRVVSGYAVLDFAVSQNGRLNAGVRVEQFRQTVDTFDLFDVDALVTGEAPEIIRGEIEETDIFPAINYTHDLGNNQNLRLGISQTVNRPEFRELAPFEFTDIVGGRAVVGNPDLERSLIRNVDIRWEWFPSQAEVIAASVFYKSFDQPIERYIQPTSQLQTSYINAESARNFGLELEMRRDLSSHVGVGANYTFVDSSITIGAANQGILTSNERALAGTSKNVFNGFIEGRSGTLTGRLLLNYVGDRIADVGAIGLPDIIEDGRTTLDLALSARLGRFVGLRVSVDNLTNEEILYTQGGLDQRVFKLGRTMMVQLSVTGQ